MEQHPSVSLREPEHRDDLCGRNLLDVGQDDDLPLRFWQHRQKVVHARRELRCDETIYRSIRHGSGGGAHAPFRVEALLADGAVRATRSVFRDELPTGPGSTGC